MSRREQPYARTYESGKKVWVARYTDSRGKRCYARPAWNRGKSTFALKRDAQRAIDEAYELPEEQTTFGSYADSWPELHPRSQRTNDTNVQRLRAVREVKIEGRPLEDWPLHELHRGHASILIGHMLEEQGRAATGAANIIRTLSAMCEDAIADRRAEVNPFMGAKVRAKDPRVRKRSREIRVWSFEQMREFAAAGRAEVRAETRRPTVDGRVQGAGRSEFFSPIEYEPMLLTFALTGMRLGEILALRTGQLSGGSFHPTGTAYKGRIIEGDSDQKTHTRTVPCPADLEDRIREVIREGSKILFPTPRGRVWLASNFYRDVWAQARIVTGMDIRPHECRHSYISHMRAAGVDDADLAQVAGQQIETMIGTYTHALGKSHEQIRELLGQ